MLSALAAHEAAIQIAAMGPALVGAASKYETITDVHKAIASMRKTATAYRGDAEKILSRIEECALLAEHLRSKCEEMRIMIADAPTRSR